MARSESSSASMDSNGLLDEDRKVSIRRTVFRHSVLSSCSIFMQSRHSQENNEFGILFKGNVALAQ